MKKLTLLLLLLFATTLIVSNCSTETVGSWSNSNCDDTNCADYSSQAEAQRDFEWDPDCRGDLDADNDGIACEENQWVDYYSSLNGGNSGGGSSSGCPQTSACGCSGHNMSECNSDPCCKWTTGSGCGCK